MSKRSSYTQEVADKMCDLLSDGISLRKVCERDDMPSKVTVLTWLRTNPVFLTQYARAKEEAADALVDDMLSIADGVDEDAQSRRVRVDTRKWIASKLKAKKYGDKIDMTTNGKDLPTPILGGITKTEE